MPNPKRRMSKARSAKRRTHYKAQAPSMVVCNNCGEMKVNHRVCPECGFYNGRSHITPKS